MTRPDLVLFDCDGVLVDSEPATNALLQRDLAAHGLPMDEAAIDREFTGGTMATVGEKARSLGATLPPDWVDGFYRDLYARLAEGTPLIDGIEAVLDRLDAAGIPYAVGSNGSEAKMRITLGQHPTMWNRLKNRLYSAHALGTAKPEPDLFLRAAADFGVPPERCVVIDDSPSGCTGGVRAGMRTLGYAAHGQDDRLAATGAEVFGRMADLPGLIGL